VNYKKGQILTYEFPPRPVEVEEIKNNKVIANYNKSKVIRNYHRVVVLHTRTTPFRTVLIAPITSAESLAGSIPANYVELNQIEYPFVLDKDSYVNLDMTMPVDEYELNELERFNKRIEAYLNPHDEYQLDFKIYLTYELESYFKEGLREEFANVVEYIDIDIREKVNNIIKKIQDPEIAQLLMDIIDNDLIGVLKETYLEKK
jgi:hypothetical protein